MHCKTGNGRYYRGTNSFTSNGLTCLSWDSLPSSSSYHPSNYPMDDIRRNYCRNPGGIRASPWCYVTIGDSGGTWEYCNVHQCNPSTIKLLSGYPGGSK